MRNFKTRALALCLLLMLALPAHAAYAVTAQRAVLSKKTAVIDLDDTLTLTARVYPAGASQDVVWKSGNNAIATVEDGVVTPKRAGRVKIGVRPAGAKAWSVCLVSIQNGETGGGTVKPTRITLSRASLNLAIGDQETLTASITPSAAPQSVKWQSSNSSVALVTSGGVVTGRKAGSALIRATSTANTALHKTIRVTVGEAASNAPTRLTLSPDTSVVGVGEKLTLTVTPEPASASASVVWASSNTGVLRVQNGVLYGVRAGKATVRVRSKLDKTVYTDRQIVVQDPGKPASVAIREDDSYMNKGDTLSLHATVLPEAATQSVSWSSSKPTVAVVSSSGVVTARSEGRTVITVKTSVGGLTDNIEITVLEDRRTTETPALTTAVSGIPSNLAKIDAIRVSAYGELESLVAKREISSSEKAQRKNILNDAFAMYRFPWMTSRPIRYWNGDYYYTPGKVYYGVPYTQTKRTYNVMKLLEGRFYQQSGNYYQATNMQDVIYPGNDCSSFVSMSIWGPNSASSFLNSTAMYGSPIYKTIGFNEMRPGDIMVRDGHVVMFLYYTDASKSSVMVIEQGGAGESEMPKTVACRLKKLSYYSASGRYIARRKSSFD